MTEQLKSINHSAKDHFHALSIDHVKTLGNGRKIHRKKKKKKKKKREKYSQCAIIINITMQWATSLSATWQQPCVVTTAAITIGTVVAG